MIELLGVGVSGDGRQWRTPAQSTALLDAVAGRVIPTEGRVWVNRQPLMRETAGRVRAAVADVGGGPSYWGRKSVFWNTLVGDGHALSGLLRFPRRDARAAALRALERVGLAHRAAQPMLTLSPPERLQTHLAEALARHAGAIVLRDVDSAVGADDVAPVLDHARTVARTERIPVVASLASPARARELADRVLVLAEGRLLTDEQVSWRPGPAAR